MNDRENQPRQLKGFDELLLAEQVKIAYGSFASSFAANVINASVLAYLLVPVVDNGRLIGWWLAMMLISFWRLLTALQFRRSGSDRAQTQQWAGRFSLGAYLGAIAWGAAAVLIFPSESIAHQALLAFVMAGMTAGASVVLASFWRPGLAYLLLPLLPLAIQFFSLDNELARAMGLMTVLYLVLMIKVSYSTHSNTMQNIRLRLQSDLHEAELRQSERELKASEARFRDISMSMADWIWEVDAEGVYTFVSGKVKEVLGYEPDEVLGKRPFDLMAPDEAARLEEVFRGIAERREPVIDLENWNIRKDGARVCILTNAVPVLDERGGLLGYRGVDQDITERRRAEDELRKLSRAVEYAGESIVITDAAGVIEYVNPAFVGLTGYSAAEAIGRSAGFLGNPDGAEGLYDALAETIAGGEVWQGSVSGRCKNGDRYSALATVAPIGSELGEVTHYVAMQLDTREYEALEARFQQAQKMEAIGTLVGGIAHDFNNMLAALVGNLYLAKSHAGDDRRMIDRLEQIESVSQRAADMIGQLLTFARKGQVEMKPLPLAPFLKEVFKLARPSIPESIEMRLHLCDESMVAVGDATQLQQVLLNLITNAAQALDKVEDPEITIGLGGYEAGSRFYQVHEGVRAGPLALLYVRDNGCGIAAAALDKVFEPFFTTKEAGKGSGLGLAMVHGAMKSHRGAVEIYSQPGTGTTVHLYLPLDQRKQIREQEERQLGELAGDGEVVLLVDDEVLVREVHAEVLESLGYRVVTAENGQHAQQVYAAHAGQVGVAVVDMVMPKMGGIEFVAWLHEQNPLLPVVLMTGYDRDQALASQPLPERCVMMNKPVDIGELSRRVRGMLEASGEIRPGLLE